MLVRFVTATFDCVAILIHSSSLDDVWCKVKLIKVRCNKVAVGVVPRALSDTVSRRYAALVRIPGTEIGPPGFAF